MLTILVDHIIAIMMIFKLHAGISRGFAFMEFYTTEDAVKWMADTKRVRELDKEEQIN